MFFVESMRFWFYSITCSIVLTCYDLYVNRSEINQLRAELGAGKSHANGDAANDAVENEKPAEKETKENAAPELSKNPASDKEQALKKAKVRRLTLIRQLIGASCDLLTPGAVVNYTPVSPAAVAITSIISSLIFSQDIWRKVNKR